MPIDLIDKIQPKNDAFVGMVDAKQVLGGAANRLPAETLPALTGDVTTTEGTVATTIAANAVTTTKLADAAVTSLKLAADSVTTLKILDANVTAAKLATDSVTTAKIVDANITTAKIADSAVTGLKIAATTITNTHIAANAAIAFEKLASPTTAFSFGNQRITNLADPTSPQDAATKAYVDAARAGLDAKDSVRLKTLGNQNIQATYNNGTNGVGATLTATANGALNAAFQFDGVQAALGDSILVTAQPDPAHNGIYVITSAGSATTPVVLTRRTDADTSAKLNAGAYVFVTEGTNNADSGWVLATNDPIVIGTSAITFVQFSGAGQVIAGAGLTKTGNQLDVGGTANRITVNADNIDIAANYVGQSSITTLGTITTGTWNGTTIAVARGGTGATTAADARTNLGATGKFAQTIGDGTATNFTVTHNLNTTDVQVQVFTTAAQPELVHADVLVTGVNTISVSFAIAPAADAYRAVVVG